MHQEKTLKQQLRHEALARRDALLTDIRIEAAIKLAEEGPVQLDLDAGTVVSGFWPMRSEMDTRPLMFALREKGARLCLPAILDRTTMVFRELVRDAEMVSMGFGTHGPGPDALELDPAVMLIPLAAFDKRGHRIGYGGGFYDRAIEKLHRRGLKPRLVGVAFDCQEVGMVPNEWHDIHLPEILTETGLRQMQSKES